MSNSAYLKKYVQNHPENKMAWYLLGKEYESTGQEGKAQYCYNQAGKVYEAFEASKVPAELWQEYQENLLQEQRRKAKRMRTMRRTGVAIILLLLIWIPSAYAPVLWDPSKPDSGAGNTTAVQGAAAEEEPEQKGSHAEETRPSLGFTAKAYSGSPGDREKALASALLESGKEGAPSETAVLGMKRSGEWSLWSKDMPVVYGVSQNSGTGTTTVQSYDSKACDCTPPDSSRFRKDAEDWINRQESLAVLSSAMQQYKLQKGKWPSGLGALTDTFPANWLAGTDPVMKEAFQPMLDYLQTDTGGGSGANGKPDGGATAEAKQTGALSAGEPFFAKPLEVIVDKENYRLAVVSGNVILRSYKVGLGGEETPEGTFRITDKVINPNGRDNGEFGSRGMQLSDTNYAIHGTNEPDSIGKDESLGCVRMTKADVEELFDFIPKGTKVTIGKGILPKLDNVPEKRFALEHRQDQTNPHRTYHWL